MTRTMSSRDRVLTAIAHNEPDRVPIDYVANPEIDQRLAQHFRLAPGDHDALLQALDVDFRHRWPNYAGPKLHRDLPDRLVDEWGRRCRWIAHETGGYWDWCDWPLENAGLEEIDAWPMPAPDDHDYKAFAAACRRYADEHYCVVAGGAGVGDIINFTGMLRTMQQVLIDLATDDPAGLRLIDRKLDVGVEVAHRALDAAHGYVDLLFIGEDLGTQIGPLMSLDMFRKHIRPRLQRYVDLAKAHNLPVMIHSCGSSSWAFDDFVDMGIAIVDTLQPEAKDMAPAYLKQRYGDRLAFHGMISTAGPVAYGSVDDVVAVVRETLEIMMPAGGYCLAPTHCLQSNSPVENVVAMYDAARQFGQY